MQSSIINVCDRGTVLLCGGLLLALAGCASVSVRPGNTSSTAQQARPEAPRKILISDFSFSEANVRADRDGKEEEGFEKKVNGDLTRALAHSIGKLGLTSEIIAQNDSLAVQPAWLIRGRYLRLNQGSRALRSFFGFGAGGTKMETAVEVYDLSVSNKTPLFTFETTGGSGAERGGLLSPSPYGVGIGVAAKTGTGVSNDTRRTARMIVAYISEELCRRGYIPQDKVQKAKIYSDD